MWQLRIRDYAGLIAAFKIRREELGWSVENLNAVCGFEDGYYGKIEIPNDASGRTLTPLTLPCILTALGLELVAVKREFMLNDAAPVGKWKRHKSKRIRREEHNSRCRAYYAAHRDKERKRRIDAYWKQKKFGKPIGQTLDNLDTKVKIPSPRSRGRDRSRGKPSDIAATL